MLTDQQKDDILYVCSLIEFIARQTKNHRGDVVTRIGYDGIARLLDCADVNHCLSFEQVSDETVEAYAIPDGTFDTVAACEYKVPSFISIGKVYRRLVLRECTGDAVQTIIDVFTSFISDAISNFNASTYYANPDYLRCSFEEGKLLD